MCMRACPWSLICPWSWISRITRSQQCNSAYVWYHVLDILQSVSTLNYLCDLNQDEMWRTDILNVRIQRTKRKQGNCTGKMERDIFYVHTFLDGDTIWRGDLWSMFVDIAQGTRHLKTSFYFYETGYFVCNFQQRERKS